MPSRQNILFIIIDQLRADCLFGALGDHVDLPNLRALMADAASFRAHFSVCNPCGPSRASILTGQYAMNHRSVRNGTPLRHDTPTLPGEMLKGGYRPVLYGYTDTSRDPRQLHPNDPRLRTYEEVMPGFEEALRMRQEYDLGPWRADLIAKGYDVPPYPDLYRPKGPNIDDPAIYSAEDSDTAFLTNAFLRDLGGFAPGWFAHLTYIRPHPPLVAPAPYNRMYDPASLPMPVCPNTIAEESARHPFLATNIASKSVADLVQGFPDLQPDTETIARLRAIYLGLATEVDHHIGRVMQALKDRGDYDDTLVVVTADHGETLGDYHTWGKQTIFDSAYHTPLIIRDPSRPGSFGMAVDCPTESVDVTPTILDLLGFDVPDSMDGRSLVPLLDGPVPDDWRKYSYSELDFGNPVEPTPAQTALGLTADAANLAILRGANHTLIQFAACLPAILFDHDLYGEAVNEAANPEKTNLLLDLTRQMLCHRMKHPDGTFARMMVTTEGLKTGAR